MSAYDILAIAGLISVLIAVAHILIAKPTIGVPVVAGVLSLGFGAYSAFTIAQDGVMLVWTNHTTNLWGVQVWWDLLFAIGIGLFLITPRARAVGMSIPLWTLFVIATASIGLLAMCARLFVLERAAETPNA